MDLSDEHRGQRDLLLSYKLFQCRKILLSHRLVIRVIDVLRSNHACILKPVGCDGEFRLRVPNVSDVDGIDFDKLSIFVVKLGVRGNGTRAALFHIEYVGFYAMLGMSFSL